MPRWGYLAVAIALAVFAVLAFRTSRQRSSPIPDAPIHPQTSATVPRESHPPAANVPVQKEGCQVHAYTGSIPLNQVQYYSPGEEDLRGGMTCTFRVNSEFPPFTFEFPGRPDNTFGDLVITEGTTGKTVQTIENESEAGMIAPATAKDVLSIVDANFDGYGDIQLLSNCGATGNCSYNFYLYDPQTSHFVHNDFLSNLGTPSFDAVKKQVTTSWNSSAADWQSEIYQFQDGQYTLIGREISEWDRKSDIVTVSKYELRNGKMELVGSESHHF